MFIWVAKIHFLLEKDYNYLKITKMSGMGKAIGCILLIWYMPHVPTVHRANTKSNWYSPNIL